MKHVYFLSGIFFSPLDEIDSTLLLFHLPVHTSLFCLQVLEFTSKSLIEYVLLLRLL
jgi:hypothetical protein